MLGVPGLMRILLIAMISMSRLTICLSLLAAASADLTLVDFSDGSPGMACALKKKTAAAASAAVRIPSGVPG